MPATDSAIPPRLRGLKLGRLFDEARASAGSPMLAAPWTPPEPAELAPLFPGFEIARLIGRGGMGAVYEARQIALERRVAIKVLPVEAGEDAAFAERFRREARVLAKLQHPHIVAVFESGETTAGHLFFVMEYVDGGDLAERARSGAFEPGDALRLVDEISSALACAHAQGVVHRDIKPSNILLTADGQAKVADFGLAVLENREPDSKLTLTGIALGTFDYAAPEQLAGRGGEDARSDLYSLGVLAYELLAGKPPRGVFDPPSLANPAVDPAVDAVVLTALQSEPERRFQSAGDFSIALNRARDFRANQLARERELRRKARRRKRVAVVAVLAAVAAIGVAAFAFLQRENARRNAEEAGRQRNAAQTARAEAEGLVDYMLNDLRGKLEASNDLTYLTDILARVGKYYGANSGDDPAFLARKAEYLRIDGRVRETLGDYAKGEASAREAVAIREALLARDGGEESHARLAQAWDGLQSILTVSKKHAPAIAAAQSALRVIAAWKSAHPGSREAAFWEAHMLHQLGDTHGNAKDYTNAPPQYEAARAAAMRLLDASPDEPRLLVKLANIHASLGSMNETLGNLEPSLEHFLKMKEFNERTGFGNDAALVASTSFRVGLALRKLGRAQEALPHLEKAVAAGEKLVARKPNDSGVLLGQQANYRELAEAQDALGQAEAAARSRAKEAALDQRRTEVAALAREAGKGVPSPVDIDAAFAKLRAAPEGNDVQFYWAMDSEAEGKRIEKARGVDAAVAYFRAQIARIDAELKAAPAGSWWLLGRSFAWNRIGFYEGNRKNFAFAAEAYRAGLADREAVLAAHPEVDRLSRDVASSANHLAHTLLELDRAAEAAEICRRIMELLRDRERGKLSWRYLLPSTATAIAPKLDSASATNALLDEAAAFLTSHGDEKLPDAEVKLLSEIQVLKK